MAVEEVSTQSTQGSTQPTQEASQESYADYTHIWGSLIPFDTSNPHIRRVDFLKSKKKYVVGRSRKKEVNDVSFPRCPKMSHRHCVIEWDGQETSTSAVVVKDLNSSNGTHINGRHIHHGEHLLLRDWAIIQFGPRSVNKKVDPREDYRFVFRHMAFNEHPNEGLYRYYDVQHVLGRGAYATVVKAMNLAEGKWYAVKMFQGNRLREVLAQPTQRDEQRRMAATARHLRREVDVLQNLKHPYICELKQAFFEGYNVSIVLELAQGGDLMSYLLKHDVLLEPEAQYFTYQVCEALAYIHQKGVVHRDLKPENVLLTDDHPPIVKVSDFGLAKVIDSLSVLQTQCGTPAFVAPEVLNSPTGSYDEGVDSWSLGVMIFMMIAKANPFPEQSREDHPKWELLREFNITDTGEDFLRCLLERDPQRRMRPAQALNHPWLAEQAPRQQARMIERELSLAARREAEAAAEAEASASPTPPAPAPARKRKRKAGLGELNRSLSILSVEEAGNREEGPSTKRARREHGNTATTSTARSPCTQRVVSMGWAACDLGSNEVPGLELWRGA